jgi:hypothetical protein
MNTQQGNSAYRISVDRYTADVLREEAKKVLEFGHDPFEDLRTLVPRDQFALSTEFRDAFAVIDAVGWAWSPETKQRAVEIPLTDGHIAQLYRRRRDLLATNIDRVEELQDARTDKQVATLRNAIIIDRLALRALDRVFDLYTEATEQ